MSDSDAGRLPLLLAAAVRLDPADDVAIARTDLPQGSAWLLNSASEQDTRLVIRCLVPGGHKVALTHITAGAPVHRYGHVIGFASQDIEPGDHVHTHNLAALEFARNVPAGLRAQPAGPSGLGAGATFLGYRRPSGRVGTRNYVAVVSTVNCSAHTARQIALHFGPERMSGYTHVDGVVAFTHPYGCPMRHGNPDFVLLQRTLAGIVRHVNVGAALLVGLGCESNQISALMDDYKLGDRTDGAWQPPLRYLVIQEQGGIRKAVRAGIERVEELLLAANDVQRTPQPIGELMLAVQCGGSDSWSGVTANPLVGLVADAVVQQGGTVVLAETPEIYGAEHLLAQRAVGPEVRARLLDKVRWWEEHTRRLGLEIDNNPSPGNRTGGLTTIYEKSLGAIAKGGSTPLVAVYDYAEPVTARGLTFMDSPGYDPVSVTGQMAGGCNLVLFTTGRGSVFGGKPAPAIKVCSNSRTFERMSDDMDFNAGVLAEGADMGAAAADLLNLVLSVASGRPSASEAQGVGEAEFNPWNLGGYL